MPNHREIRDFAAQVAKEMGYNLLDEASESRVVLLSRLEKPIRLAYFPPSSSKPIAA